MRGLIGLKSFAIFAAVSGAFALAGCQEGNPTGKGATPSGSADQRTDDATRVPDIANGGTGTAGTGSGATGNGPGAATAK